MKFNQLVLFASRWQGSLFFASLTILIGFSLATSRPGYFPVSMIVFLSLIFGATFILALCPLWKKLAG